MMLGGAAIDIYTSVQFRLYCISLLNLLVVVRPIIPGNLGVVDLRDDRRWSFKRGRGWYRGILMFPHNHWLIPALRINGREWRATGHHS